MPTGPASRVFRLCTVLILGLAIVAASRSEPPEPKKGAVPGKKGPGGKPLADPAPPEALLRSDAWHNVPMTPLQPGEIDQLLDQQFQASKIVPSPLTSDEQFLRRLRLDLTGQLPTSDEIEQFLADQDPDKRAKWADKLLAGDEYARHWARYWRETVSAVEAPFGNGEAPDFEDWLCEQFKQNRSWGDTVRAMLTAEGSLKKGSKGANGQVFFLGRHVGADGDISRTAETARLFLGIQIQCAQCHNDRRTKFWKQVQFHELAGFFARMTVGGSNGQFIKLNEKKVGEHEMPDRKDPKLLFVTYPRFLDGKAPPVGASDKERRQALADYLTAKDNYWFSAAYVNRIWNELLGQSFSDRVDDLSPKGEVVFPAVFSRLAAGFQASDYDPKALLRAVVTSKAYQRQVRLGDAVQQHLQFAAMYPTRLRADVLWQSLGRLLVHMPTNPVFMQTFLTEFGFDPSLKPDEVPLTIPQALWLLNNPLLNDRVKVSDMRTPPPKPVAAPTLLKQLLTKHGTDDGAALRELYLQTLARKPTDHELQTCLQFIQEVKQDKGSRNEAFEDIFKALLNSTEFQRKR